MKIFNIEQIRARDQYTIENEPIESLDLMKRAAQRLADFFIKIYDRKKKVLIFCGQGNNGGDGLVVARLLDAARFEVEVYTCHIGKPSNDFEHLMKYRVTGDITLYPLRPEDKLPVIDPDCILIDALFGTGLNKELTGFAAALVKHINQSGAEIVSIDIPSGMFADAMTTGLSIHAHRTISFESPKTAFFFKENQERTGHWDIVSIGLHNTFEVQTPTDKYYITASRVKALLKTRKKHDHKGTFGHALLIAGSKGKAGAAVLAARGCLRSGVGLLTLHLPACACDIAQISVPEAMVSIDTEENIVSALPDIVAYDAIGIGCGIGQSGLTLPLLERLLEKAQQPLVIDADALNIMSEHRHLLEQLPPDSILTPHPKEFERLFGEAALDFDKWKLQAEKSRELGIYIVLKGAHTRITTPGGETWFNATGNPGMATGGSGDVLTGMLTGLLAQGYPPLQAAVIGVYLHGLSGDLAIREKGMESLIAGDLPDYLGKAMMEVRK